LYPFTLTGCFAAGRRARGEDPGPAGAGPAPGAGSWTRPACWPGTRRATMYTPHTGQPPRQVDRCRPSFPFGATVQSACPLEQVPATFSPDAFTPR